MREFDKKHMNMYPLITEDIYSLYYGGGICDAFMAGQLMDATYCGSRVMSMRGSKGAIEGREGGKAPYYKKSYSNLYSRIMNYFINNDGGELKIKLNNTCFFTGTLMEFIVKIIEDKNGCMHFFTKKSMEKDIKYRSWDSIRSELTYGERKRRKSKRESSISDSFVIFYNGSLIAESQKDNNFYEKMEAIEAINDEYKRNVEINNIISEASH